MKLFEQKTLIQIVFGILLGAAFVSAAIFISLPDKMTPLVILPTSTDMPIQVHVVGEVKNPGVVILSKNSRVQDAINSAGGATDEADLQPINLAAFVTDGQKLIIPSFNHPEIQPLSTAQQESFPKIDLNSATQKELETLPGIGEEKAKAILSEREKLGGFKSLDELSRVSGITRNILNQIKPYLSVVH